MIFAIGSGIRGAKIASGPKSRIGNTDFNKFGIPVGWSCCKDSVMKASTASCSAVILWFSSSHEFSARFDRPFVAASSSAAS
jgi:hypothetical protein